MTEATLCGGLRNLSELLQKYYDSTVIILIDEYDVPLAKAFENGYYELSEAYGRIKEWYDGYRFGNVEVYCPWDVINYCDLLRADPEAEPQDYWSNSSSIEIVKQFIRRAGVGTTKHEIEKLVAGETVTKEIHQELTYKELYSSIDHIWSVLFTTGYLTQRGKPRGDVFDLVIPNMEIRKIFTRQIMEMFKENVEKDGEALEAFCESLKAGDGDLEAGQG